MKSLTATPALPMRTASRALRRTAALIAMSAMVTLMGCAANNAQNSNSALKPVNAHVIDDVSPVMLKGHDVVAYFTQGKHALGSAQFSSQYEGIIFRFASLEHKTLFDKEPTKYIPQYGGYCTNGIAYAIPWGGDADSWSIRDGKLYIYGGKASKEGFELDIPRNTELAEKYWKEEIKGNNSFIQRTKRLIFRVPHYISAEEQDRLIAAKKAKG